MLLDWDLGAELIISNPQVPSDFGSTHDRKIDFNRTPLWIAPIIPYLASIYRLSTKWQNDCKFIVELVLALWISRAESAENDRNVSTGLFYSFISDASGHMACLKMVSWGWPGRSAECSGWAYPTQLYWPCIAFSNDRLPWTFGKCQLVQKSLSVESPEEQDKFITLWGGGAKCVSIIFGESLGALRSRGRCWGRDPGASGTWAEAGVIQFLSDPPKKSKCLFFSSHWLYPMLAVLMRM